MAGGALGAVGMWMHEARRQAREQQRKTERVREARRAARGTREAPRSGSEPSIARCMGCGFLELPRLSGDPMRATRAAADAPEKACPHCGEQAWVLLGGDAEVRALCELEHHEIQQRRGIPGSIATTATVLIAFAGCLTAAILVQRLIVVGVFALIALWISVSRLRARLAVPRRRAFRWHTPARHHAMGAQLRRGRLAGENSVIAPASGRPCLAWRVEVRYTGDRGRAFALVEQETAELRIDTETIVGAVTIGGVATDVTDPAPGLRAYLCSRGLDPDDELEIREIVLVAGDAVAMHHDRCGGPTILMRAA